MISYSLITASQMSCNPFVLMFQVRDMHFHFAFRGISQDIAFTTVTLADMTIERHSGLSSTMLFGRLYMTSYQFAIVNATTFCTVSEISSYTGGKSFFFILHLYFS